MAAPNCMRAAGSSGKQPVALQLVSQRTALVLIDGAGAQLSQSRISARRKLHPLRDQRQRLGRGMYFIDQRRLRELHAFDRAPQHSALFPQPARACIWLELDLSCCVPNCPQMYSSSMRARHGNVKQPALFLLVKSLGIALPCRVLAAQLLRKLDQRFLVTARETIVRRRAARRRRGTPGPWRRAQSSVAPHRAGSPVTSLGASAATGSSSAMSSDKTSVGLLKERRRNPEIRAAFHRRVICFGLLPQSLANSCSRCSGNESPSWNEVRMIRIAAGIMPFASARSCRASRTASITSSPPGTFSSTDSTDASLPASASSSRKRSGSTWNCGNAATRNSATGSGPSRMRSTAMASRSLRGVEQIGALYLYRNTAAAELVCHLLAMPMAAIQHREIAVLHRGPSPPRGFDGVGDEVGLLALVVHDGVHRGSLAPGFSRAPDERR